MSWNGSNGQNVPTENSTRHGNRALPYALLSVAVIAIGAAIIYFVFNDDAQPQDAVSNKDVSKAIPTVQAAHIQASPVSKPDSPKIDEPQPVTSGKKLNYEALAAKGKVVITNKYGRELVMTPKRERKRPKYAIFNHTSENRIASLMTAVPGTRFFGEQNYGDKFIEDFKNSCEEPILISSDDDEYTKQLKQEMIQTKIALLDRMRNGEDLCQIMTDTRKELQRLGIVKTEIQRSMKDLIKTTAKSESDVDDCIAAANQMLERKGIAPIQMTPMIRYSLMRLANVESVEPADDFENE